MKEQLLNEFDNIETKADNEQFPPFAMFSKVVCCRGLRKRINVEAVLKHSNAQLHATGHNYMRPDITTCDRT